MSARFLLSEPPGKDTDMTYEDDAIADRMKTVKDAWDKAPDGPKKNAALRHYRAAERAHIARNDSDTKRELDAAINALV
jgi:hypothetical protein